MRKSPNGEKSYGKRPTGNRPSTSEAPLQSAAPSTYEYESTSDNGHFHQLYDDFKEHFKILTSRSQV